MCSAVCSCHKLLTFSTCEYSFNKDTFAEFLADVRSACGEEPIYLFLDNASFHKSPELKPVFDTLKIKPVWNVAYSPEFNSAIELYWAQLKAYFRPLLLQKMLAGPRARDTPLRDAVYQTIREVPQSSIPLFIARGLSCLRERVESIRAEQNQ